MYTVYTINHFPLVVLMFLKSFPSGKFTQNSKEIRRKFSENHFLRKFPGKKKLTKECPGNSSGEIFCCFDTFKFIHGSTIFATKLGMCKYNLNVHKSNTWCLHVEVHMFTQNSKGWVCIIQVAAYLCRARFFFRWLTLRIPMANI